MSLGLLTRFLVVFCCALVWSPTEAAPKSEELPSADEHRLQTIFGRFTTEVAAISPDGMHLAYSLRYADRLEVVITGREEPGKVKASVVVGLEPEDEFGRGKIGLTPPLVTQLTWESATRVVCEVRGGRWLTEEHIYFDYSAGVPSGLKYYLSNRDVNLKRTDSAPHASYGFEKKVKQQPSGKDAYIYAAPRIRSASTNKQKWTSAFEKLRARMPGKLVSLRSNDAANQYFVVTVEDPVDPGVIFLYDAKVDRLVEIARRRPGRESELVHESVAFEVKGTRGDAFFVLVTKPARPIQTPAPVVVLPPPNGRWKPTLGYNAVVQAFADMGYMVVQYEGYAAQGAEPRETGGILTAEQPLLRLGRAVDCVREEFRTPSGKIAVFGAGREGYLALLAVRQYPHHIGRALVVDLALPVWDGVDGKKIHDMWLNEQELFSSFVRVGDAYGMFNAGNWKPLLFPEDDPRPKDFGSTALVLRFEGKGDSFSAKNSSVDRFLVADAIEKNWRKVGATIEVGELKLDFVKGPEAKAEAYQKIAAFLRKLDSPTINGEPATR